MEEHGYRYTVCFDTGVQMNFGGIKKGKIYTAGQVLLYRTAKDGMKKVLKSIRR